MKKWTMVLVVICYIVAIAAFIEGICKGIIMNGIITGAAMWWLGNQIKKQVKDYDTESN